LTMKLAREASSSRQLVELASSCKRGITICENAHTHSSYLSILLTCQTVISLHTCCIKTLVRPRHNSYIYIAVWQALSLSCCFTLCHWTGNDIVFRHIAFYVVFCVLFGPAFWHAFNKRILIDWLIDWLIDCWQATRS